MQLKRLEAYGFKSFAEKIEIEFDKGITAIVGPNGSGKSNITDAIRWVLGEQNVRTLRGLKSEDIIFAGSTSRRQMGVAEVSLSFENDGTLPVDFSEVVVTRRLFRNGDSEYYINKARCRLKDIINLFADTGLGHDGMSVISQNKVDEVLNARPEERRLFFEEAAGITKYRNRKREALRKLEETNNNLLRVEDIIGEIDNQLKPLEESAKRTIRYGELQRELKKLNLVGMVHEYRDIKEKAEESKKEILEAREQMQAARTATQLIDNKKELLQNEILTLENEEKKLLQGKNEYQEKISNNEREIEVLEERSKQGKETLQLLEKQRKDWEQAISSTEKEISELENSSKNKLEEQKSIEDNIKQSLAGEGTLSEEIGHLTEEAKALEEEIKLKSGRLQTKQGEYQLLCYDIETDGEARENRARKQKELQKSLKAGQEEEASLKERQTIANAEEMGLKIGLAANEQKEASLKNKITELRVEQARLNKEINGGQSRLQVMENLQKSYDGFGKAVKAVLKSKLAWRKKLCGAVAEIIEVPSEYITAVEVALGGNLQNIVAEDNDAAKGAIEFLKREKLGRVTFLPLDTIVVRSNDENVDMQEAGVIGWADTIVSTEAKFSKIVKFLLGRTLVVDTLDNALALAKKNNQKLRIVTLQGEYISPGGSLSGGSTQERESSFLNRKDEIQRLVVDLKRDKLKLEQAVSSFNKAEKEIAIARSEKQKNIEDLQALKLKLTEIITLLGSNAEELNRYKAEIDELNRQGAEADANLAEKKDVAERLKLVIAGLQKEISADEIRLEATNVDLTERKQRVEGLFISKNELEKQVASLKQEIIGIQNQKALHEKNLKQYKDSIATGQKEIDQREQELSESRERVGEILQVLQRLEREHEKISVAHKGVYQNRMSLVSEAKKIEEDIREASQKISMAGDRVHKLEMLASRIEYDSEQLEENLLKEYGLVPESAIKQIPDISENQAKQEQSKLNLEIEELGTINPNAPEEYEQLKNRRENMSEQADDLIGGRENLISILGEMDETMTHQFIEAFEKIGVYFDEIFMELFGGGQAQLNLMDKENVLESGVDIVVQLPEKKRQSLSALSGGERALTVVALLFSFLRYRPAPFSVLDEVDAPLDEANIARFRKFLKDYSENTQFIMVTHRKATMEVADTMYGVTIEDAGVSKVLSVRLGDV